MGSGWFEVKELLVLSVKLSIWFKILLISSVLLETIGSSWLSAGSFISSKTSTGMFSDTVSLVSSISSISSLLKLSSKS